VTRDTPRWVKIWALWTLFGLVTAVQTHYRYEMAERPISWGKAVAVELSFVWMWALLTPLVLWTAGRFPISRAPWWRNSALHLALAVAIGIASKGAWDAVFLPLFELGKQARSPSEAIRMALLSLDYGVLHYCIVLLAQTASSYFRRAEKDRLRAVQLETELARAQLQALKMQLHPHFLFNTLNTISELVHHDPDTAEKMVIRLSDFLRLTLDHMGIPEVPLMVELDFLKRYLEIEQMRFEDRLKVNFEIDAASVHGRVPNLILQPIVENALKHGLSRISGPGRLQIRACSAAGRLFLRVHDNGPGVPQNGQVQVKEGVGIGNTRRRLRQVYGDDHIFSMSNIPSGGFEVTIEVPLRLSP
jgi:two-component system LytT family sensor kinase